MHRQRSQRVAGISKSISLHLTCGHLRFTKTLNATGQAVPLVENMFEDHNMDVDTGGINLDSPLVPSDSDDESVLGEDSEFSGLTRDFSTLCPVDDRDRRDRTEHLIQHWSIQMPQLVAAYLEYRSCDPGD
ncbi:hypothetical protein L210DRAFT_791098, partial [Boletus edulis BED1]